MDKWDGDKKTTLDKIKEKLESLEYGPVFYGAVPEMMELEEWNYLVFSRVSNRFDQRKTSITPYYEITIVAEDYVPEDIVKKVLWALDLIPGMSLAGEEIPFDYIRKPNTSTVVETATITMCEPQKYCKRCGSWMHG